MPTVIMSMNPPIKLLRSDRVASNRSLQCARTSPHDFHASVLIANSTGKVFALATETRLLLRTQAERFFRCGRFQFALGLFRFLLFFPFIFVSHTALGVIVV